MKTVVYCRVSTNKEDQLNSLEAQKEFFGTYSERNDYDLIKIYADEGKSGTKTKNRPQLLRLLSDAGRKEFDLVLIKDVSRLARNTVDFLTSIRRLKALGIKVVFVNYDQTSSESSEFMLTLLSAMAQEESYNTSKRVKFGKKQNAEKGKVPNIVYGYDKIIGDSFNLNINEVEAVVVRRIYQMYVDENWGAKKIAMQLNSEGIQTKRGCKWSQNAIARIVTNEIYIGKIVNGKQEVADFLTGERKIKDEEDWIIVKRPELRLIDDKTYEKAQKMLADRTESFNITGERKTDKYVFTKLIRCAHCNYSFRRVVFTYKNTYTRWLCSGRNIIGAETCENKTKIEETELLTAIRDYFTFILKDKPNVIKSMVAEFNRQYKERSENIISEKDITKRLNKARKEKQKYMEMFNNDIIDMKELREKSKELNETIERLEADVLLVQRNITKSDVLETALTDTFKDIETVLKNDDFTNEMLSRIIEYISVDKDGNVDVYLKMLSDIGLENNYILTYNHTSGYNNKT
ncbi:MAG: recombinase family protein [Oscillospiraceae bacterium]|nr:recombinase family protein [Oscillospiraceae bacterium]